MSGFLDTMTRSSRARAAEASGRESASSIRVRALATPPPPELRLHEAFGLIAEYKRRSPSQGGLARDDRLVDQVTAYALAGASAVSVLTEPMQFEGDLEHLSQAASALTPLDVPVMRKDFLVDPYQLYETRAAGAGGALLIVRTLSAAQLREMLDCANELKLFVLLETFDCEDIARVTNDAGIAPGPARGAPVLLGVNCRDLVTLDLDPRRFHEFAKLLPDNVPRVAESGFSTPDDCADAARIGYDLVLVGSALMKTADPFGMIETMLSAARAAAKAAA
jgi:indole-3-glycerol phosphate synthase